MISRRSFFGFPLGMAAAQVPGQIQPFSIFTGAPNRLQEPVTAQGNLTNPTRTPIQLQADRQSLWYSGFLNPTISPTIDSTFEWPLHINSLIRTITFTSAAAVKLIQGTTGFHSQIVRMSVTPATPVAGDVVIVRQMLPSIPNNFDNIAVLTQLITGFANPIMTPVINCVSSDTNRGYMVGTKSTYLPEGFDLEVFYGSAAYPVNMDVIFSYITAPSNQPMSSLFNY